MAATCHWAEGASCLSTLHPPLSHTTRNPQQPVFPVSLLSDLPEAVTVACSQRTLPDRVKEEGNDGLQALPLQTGAQAVNCKQLQYLPGWLVRARRKARGPHGSCNCAAQKGASIPRSYRPSADAAAPNAGASSEGARAARAGVEPRCGEEEEEGASTRRGRKPDSCRGGGGLLGTETRDAVAAEKSVITHSAGGGDTTQSAYTRDPGSSGLREPLPAAPPPLPTLSGRPGFAPPAEIPHPHHRRRRRRLRQPSEISARRPGARRGSKTRRLPLRQTRLYVCGAGAHAQTPSSLLLLGQPPPLATAAASSGRRSPLLLLRSGAGPSSADAARDPGIRWSRRKALVTTTTAPSPPAALPRHPPTHPPRSPTPTNPTSRSFERRRLQSLQQPLWPPTPPRKESSPPPAAPSRPRRGSSGVRTSRLRRKRTRAARIVGVSARPAALRGGSGAGPFLPEDVCRAEAPARREENARAPWLPVMERSLGSRCHRRRRAPTVLREDPASLRARPRPVAGLTVPGAPPPPRSEPRRAGSSRGQRFLTEQPPRAQGV
ncbi:WAS/WASL-interacting protein family member 1-like [Eubalaena glacialis]|uniref:WAS/WASL-interacting protein family member 1-like n=1 Tax=Eubalaena glacialis TaxID=27606 RepID=UPI002A59F8CB|nr:WAS/WASL-interacting protein family member 1-like [Eubalaena glacialis]